VEVLQPQGGVVLRSSGALTLAAQGVNGVEPVEVTRTYTWDPVARTFDSPELNRHGLHLPADLHVPVRRFEVEVVDNVPPRSAPDPATAPLAGPVHAGDTVYVIVPVAVNRALQLSGLTYPPGTPAAVTNPAPAIGVHVPSAAVLPLVAPGNIFRVTFGVADPPEAAAQLEFDCIVALSDGETDVSCLVSLEPHFTLDAAAFTVARGGRLSLTCSGGVVPAAAPVVTPAAGVAVTIAGSTVHLDVAAAAPGAATHNRTVLVTDSANPSHRARRTFTITP
jgi:hypothetical protein